MSGTPAGTAPDKTARQQDSKITKNPRKGSEMAARKEESRVSGYVCGPLSLDDGTVKVVRSMARQWPRLSRMQLRVTVADDGRVFVADSYVLREHEAGSSTADTLAHVGKVAGLGDRFGLRVNLAGKAHPVLSVAAMTGTIPTVESLEKLYPTGPTVGLSVSTMEDLEESYDGVELTRFWANGEYPVAHPVWVDNARFGPFGGFSQFGAEADGFMLATQGGFKPILVQSGAGRRLGLIMPMRIPGADPWTVKSNGTVRDGGSRAEYYRTLPRGTVTGRR